MTSSLKTLSDEQVRVMSALEDDWKKVHKALDKKTGDEWQVYEKLGKVASIYTDTLPRYTDDLNAAMQLVEVMKDHQFECVRHWKSGLWSCAFIADEEDHHTLTGYESLALCICHAFLLARGKAVA